MGKKKQGKGKRTKKATPSSQPGEVSSAGHGVGEGQPIEDQRLPEEAATPAPGEGPGHPAAAVPGPGEDVRAPAVPEAPGEDPGPPSHPVPGEAGSLASIAAKLGGKSSLKKLADAGKLTDAELEVLAGLAAQPDALLSRMLREALPYWTDKAHQLDDVAWASRREYVADMVACRADLLMRGSKKKGDVAGVFNAMAEGLGMMVVAGGSVQVEAFLAGLGGQGHVPVLDTAAVATDERLELDSRLDAYGDLEAMAERWFAGDSPVTIPD